MNSLRTISRVFLLVGVCLILGQPSKAATPALPVVAVTNGLAENMMRCLTCNGSKTVTVELEEVCKSCGGTGKIKSSWSKAESPCNFCRGTGKIKKTVQAICPSCHGRGIISSELAAQFQVCPTCHGEREMETNTVVSCQACGGSGKSSRGFGLSSGFGGKGSNPGGNQGDAACPICHGTGKVTTKVKKPCPTCFGAGVVPPPPEPVPPTH